MMKINVIIVMGTFRATRRAAWSCSVYCTELQRDRNTAMWGPYRSAKAKMVYSILEPYGA